MGTPAVVPGAVSDPATVTVKLSTTTLTTAAGAVAAAAMVAQQMGIHVGHIGNGDWLSLLGGVATLLLGYFAKGK
jgi:hypothetical protein